MELKHILVIRPEIQNKLFNKVIGKDGNTYYYNGNPTSIWMDGDKTGSGGRSISYDMMDGGEESLQGPWNGNTKDFLEQTGIDLTKMSYSFGLVFGTRQEALDFQNGKDVEPLHYLSDKEWKLGEFNGGERRMITELCNHYLEDKGYQIVNINSLGGVSIMTF